MNLDCSCRGEAHGTFARFFQLSIKRLDYFRFLIPVTAFGIRDDMIMEVSVEYTVSDDKTYYMPNIWARERGAKSKRFLYAPAVPAGDDPDQSIIEYLNQDEVFHYLMDEYIREAAKHRSNGI